MTYKVDPLFTIKQVVPKVFHVAMDNKFDLGMTFLRYQEYYESSSSYFYRQNFRIVDFMSWYTHERKKSYFTYPIDWSGYNIPGWIFEKVWDNRIYYSDSNGYDRTMELIIQTIKENWGVKDYNFYLIGTMKENSESTLLHEIAHGLYSTNTTYKKETDKIIATVPNNIRTKMYGWLGSIGYNSDVFEDELQAYFSMKEGSEGLRNVLIEATTEEKIIIEKICKEFNDNFNNFYKPMIVDESFEEEDTQKILHKDLLE